MVKIKQIIEGKIASLDEVGNGILYSGKDRIFVRHVILNEVVRVRVVKKLQKGYAGELLEIIKPSENRGKVNCGIYDRCGSCQLLHMKEQAQHTYKLEYLQNLCKQAKELSLKCEGLLSMEDPYHYRNKMIIGFQRDKRKKIRAGFYEEFSHTIIPYQNCLLHPKECDEIVQTIVKLMEQMRIEPYDEDSRRGLLRHVILRYGEVSKQIMVVLVVNSVQFPARRNFVNALVKAHPQITTIVQNINTRKTSIVLGNEERVLYGKGYIEDTLCGLTFRISAKSFYQINHAQTEVLYKKAIEKLQLKGNEKILDAYCGIGTIGMYAAGFVKEVMGVEINKDSIKDAKDNAYRNHVKNIRFICDDAGSFMQKMAQQKEKLDVVIMDPPRSGSDECFIRSAVGVKPKKILYISCNPQTQIRDLKLFKKLGYEGKEVLGVDLFPHTFHVETVVLLSKLKTKKHIDIELHTDELDLTSSESKATYQEIKQYVLDKYGFKVSTLNIAQTKQKCGIKERDNYNKPKMENSKQPNCPKEKEDAIKDAFRYFQMI